MIPSNVPSNRWAMAMALLTMLITSGCAGTDEQGARGYQSDQQKFTPAGFRSNK